jgi:hypothetical protein
MLEERRLMLQGGLRRSMVQGESSDFVNGGQSREKRPIISENLFMNENDSPLPVCAGDDVESGSEGGDSFDAGGERG